MSLLSFNVDDPDTRRSIREFVDGFLRNRLGIVRTSDEITFTVQRKSDHISVDWEGDVEASIPGPDPDLISARLYHSHAEVDLRLSGIRINYS